MRLAIRYLNSVLYGSEGSCARSPRLLIWVMYNIEMGSGNFLRSDVQSCHSRQAVRIIP